MSNEFTYTPSQKQAIESTSTPIIVSAAAGSGKTKVLTERLISRIVDGANITDFLVITFTRAAAAELKSRIIQELTSRASENTSSRRLKHQADMIYRAQIGTIDSFCTSFVRENAHILGISPAFKVLDEEKSQMLREKALEDVIEKKYANIENNLYFRQLVDTIGAGRDDSRLASLVLSIDEQLNSRAFPEEWATSMIDSLDVSGITDAGKTIWGRYLLNVTAKNATYYKHELDNALHIMEDPENHPLAVAYGSAFSQLGNLFSHVIDATSMDDSWNATKNILSLNIPRLGPVRNFPHATTKSQIKNIWDNCKAGLVKMQKQLAGESSALINGIQQSKPILSALLDLVLSVRKNYATRKRKIDACDFSDVEHYCITLLCDKEKNPTPLAHTVSSKYKEVMVDEYQDVNAVQELIFQLISENGKKLFMVGDVKQSIYRFRLAEPSIFNHKLDSFADPANGTRILLKENFRSRKSILDACNMVFSNIMSKDLGEIEYSTDAMLVHGATFPTEGEVKPELCLLDVTSTEDEESPDKSKTEARYVASRIHDMVNSGEVVSDGNGGTRPITYNDIAILLRTPKTSGAIYKKALMDAGIPVNAKQGGAFFSQPEIKFALSMLSVIDNPHQDIPLIAALSGAPFAFSSDDLASVRLSGDKDLWDTLVDCAEIDPRCARFVNIVNELRDLALEENTDSLIRWMYDKTRLLDICAATKNSTTRISNLMQLFEYARQFEMDGSHNLFRFLAWLKQMEEKGVEPPVVSSGSNSVQIMSIHKAKGLEFPVVFLVDNSHRWNRQGIGQILCHSELGFGARMTDAEKGISWPTLPWRAIDEKIKQEDLSEQERVLYVAMTRARERLIMTCTVKNATDVLESYKSSKSNYLDPKALSTAMSTTPWLIAAAVKDDGKTIYTHVIQDTQTTHNTENAQQSIPEVDANTIEALKKRLAWKYPHMASVTIPSKVTATSLNRASIDTDSKSELPIFHRSLTNKLRLPNFKKDDRPLTGAEKGTATHLVMQHIDLTRVYNVDMINAELNRLTVQGYITDRQKKCVDPYAILAFFQSSLGRRVLSADDVQREFQFMVMAKANEWWPDADKDETVLLQGIVDCFIDEGDSITIIDFKTDTNFNPEEYTTQICTYATAMARVYQKPVKQAYLWYVRHNKQYEVSLRLSHV